MRKDKITTIFGVIISIYPILSQYKFIYGLHLGYFVILLFIILYIINNRFMIRVNLIFLILIIIFAFMNILVVKGLYNIFSNSIANALYLLFIAFIGFILFNPIYGDIRKIYKPLKYVAVILTIFLFYQFIQYYIFSVSVSGEIPFLTSVYSGFSSIYIGRPTSFFYEPSHYVIYISPILYLSYKYKDKFTSIILVLGVLASTSLLGLLILFVFVVYHFKDFYIKSFSVGKITKIFSAIIIILLVLMFVNSITGNRVASRFNLEYFLNSVRVFKSFEYIKFFRSINYFIGVGYNELDLFVNKFHAYILVGSKNYAGGFLYMYLSFGFIGVILIFIMYLKFFRDTDKNYTALFILLIVVSMFDQIFFNRNFVYLVLFLYFTRGIPYYGTQNTLEKFRYEVEK